MDTFKQFMTETKFLLPNWSWIAIALVVLAAIIIIACSVALGRKKKRAQKTGAADGAQIPENGESAQDKNGEDLDKLIEPFYPAPGNVTVYEGAGAGDEIYAPAEEPEAAEAQHAEEVEYRSEHVGEEQVDEVTYSAVVTPVDESEEKPEEKKPAAKKTASKKPAAKKSTAKQPAKKSAAKKTVAEKPVEEVKEAETAPAVPENTEKKSGQKPKKNAVKKTAEKKPVKSAANKKPVKEESVPTVSDVLTEDIPAPAQTEPEVAAKKPKTEKKPAAKKAAAKKAENKPAESAKPKAEKPVQKKADKKPAAKKTANKKPKIEYTDVAQAVASATPTGEEKVYHVSKRPQDNKWEVRIEGSSKAIKLFRTKKEAEEFAIPLAGDDTDNVRVVIHRADGRPKNVAYL